MRRNGLPMLEFTLLTLNIHQGFSALKRRFVLAELREAVRTVSADVVCLQEVLGAHEPLSRRHACWPAVPHYEFIADTLWPQFAYGRNAVYPEGHHGNAMLSKFPIAQHRNVDVSVPAAEQRGMLWCVLEVPGTAAQIHAVCVHLGLREGHRRQQLGALRRLVEDEVPADAPLVVAGDFNDWRRSADAVLARCGLREAFVAARGRHARTFPARWPLLALDRIYVRGVRAARPRALSGRPWSHLSDHAPLLVEVQA
jgi:endonuclease/exonuclease/phosphatase family metal-dependent hydrolase